MWQLLTDTLVKPGAAFARLRGRPEVVLGLLVGALGSALLGLGSEPGGTFGDFDVSGATTGMLNAAGAIVILVISTAAVHAAARLLGGRASFAAAISALGLASLPLVLYAPVHVIATLAGAGAWIVAAKVPLLLWSLVLDIAAVRTIYALSTGRAIAALALTVAGIVALAIVAGVVIGIGAIVAAP